MCSPISKLEDQSKVQQWARAQGTAGAAVGQQTCPSQPLGGTGVTPGLGWEQGAARLGCSRAGHGLQQGLMGLICREGRALPCSQAAGHGLQQGLISCFPGKGRALPWSQLPGDFLGHWKGWLIVKCSQLWDGLSGRWRSPHGRII